METLELPVTGRNTTRLGFGCAHLMGAIGRRESSAILETAYDAGIRHFDVAPMYGGGDAEKCLGEFVGRHRGDITITTKFGIAPGRKRRVFSATRALGRPIVRLFPGLKARRQAIQKLSPPEILKTSFSVDEAALSLENSLVALKTEHIDLFLLHEATADDLNDDRLLRFLEDAAKSGKIGQFGVGSDRMKIAALIARRPQYCALTQYQWSVFDDPGGATSQFRIHHGVFNQRVMQLHTDLLQNPLLCRNWSEEIGCDLADSSLFSKLVLRTSLVMNPGSMILISSKNPRHVQANCAAAADIHLDQFAARFYQHVKGSRLPN